LAIAAAAWMLAAPAMAQDAGPAAADKPVEKYGIAAVLTTDGGDYVSVESLGEDGAAQRDGRLKVGDRIAGIAEGNAAFVDCKGKDVHSVWTMTRGDEGSIIRLEVIPAGATDLKKREIITLTRSSLHLASLTHSQQAKEDREMPKLEAALGKATKEEMRKAIANVVEWAGLDTTGSSALEAAAAGVVDQNVKDSSGKLAEALTEYLVRFGSEQRAQVFDKIDNDPEKMVKELEGSGGIGPADSPAWKAALKKVLSPVQAAAWADAEANHHEEIEKRINDYLGMIANSGANQAQQQIQPEADIVRSTLNLAPDRLARFNALSSSVAEDYVKSLRAQYEKALLKMPDEDRETALKGRRLIGVYISITPVLDEWRTAVEKMLTPDEIKQLKTAKEERAAALEQALGRLMDEYVALTSAQRAKLEPMTADLVKSSPRIIEEFTGNNYYSISLSELLGTGNGADQDRIKAILDASQWQHWQDAAAGKNLNEYIDQEQVLQLPAAGDSGTPAPERVAEPDTVDKAISAYMADKSKTERQKVFAEKLLKAEDAARILDLPADSAQRLKAAACGAADAFMTGWSNSAEQTVRANLGTITADTVEQRLQSIQNYELTQAEENSSTGTPQDDVWDQTVKTLLNQDQMKAWKAETDARDQYESDAMGGWITVSFAQRFALSPDQAARLRPMVAKILKKYGDRIGSYFQYSSPWYLEAYSMYLPFAGIEDHEMSAILTKDQIDHWKSSPMHSETTMYWQNIAR
jgi:hypothetical protein